MASSSWTASGSRGSDGVGSPDGRETDRPNPGPVRMTRSHGDRTEGPGPTRESVHRSRGPASHPTGPFLSFTSTPVRDQCLEPPALSTCPTWSASVNSSRGTPHAAPRTLRGEGRGPCPICRFGREMHRTFLLCRVPRRYGSTPTPARRGAWGRGTNGNHRRAGLDRESRVSTGSWVDLGGPGPPGVSEGQKTDKDLFSVV